MITPLEKGLRNWYKIVGLAGIVSCAGPLYNTAHYGLENEQNQREYSFQPHLQEKGPRRINRPGPARERYAPIPKEEISDRQEMAGWCTAALISAGFLGAGAIGYEAGNPEMKEMSFTFEVLGGLGLIPSLPMCIYTVSTKKSSAQR